MRAGGIAMLVVYLATVRAPRVQAEPFNLATASTDRPNLVVASTGLDHGFVGELGYLRVVDALGRRTFVGAALELPWAHFDLGDFALRPTLGIVALGGRAGGWALAGFVRPTIRGATNPLARMTSVGADVCATGGWYARRGFVAGEVGLDWSAATYLRHSDAYRMTVYPDVQDGWYRETGATIYAGATAGLSLGSYDLSLQLGVPRDLELDAQTVPWFVRLGVTITLPR